MNELKKELSKLSGVNFFNPKFRDVFKKYFPEDKEEELNMEEERAEELNLIDESEFEEKEENTKELKESETSENEEKTEDENMVDESALEEDLERAETDESESKNIDDMQSVNQDLLDAKIELELVRSNIRPEKIKPAMILAKQEIKSLNELEKVAEIIKEYPEWIKKQEQARAFGMNVDESGDGLTEEEKRLKQMGIDPRN